MRKENKQPFNNPQKVVSSMKKLFKVDQKKYNANENRKEKTEKLLNCQNLSRETNEKLKLFLKNLENSIKETEELNKLYQDKIDKEHQKQREDEKEMRELIYKEEYCITDIKKKMDENVKKLAETKADLNNLQTQYNCKFLQLNEILSKINQYQNKLDCFSFELNEKVKLKNQYTNELNSINQQIEQAKCDIDELTRIDSEYIDYIRMLHNDYQESKGNIRVFCRVRPPLEKESTQERATIEYPNYNSIILHGPVQKSNIGKSKDTHVIESYKFDRVFTPKETQEDIFKEISQLVQSALDGYKVCIFAYGQTGSGKTYTMEGEADTKRGLIPRSIEQIFNFKRYLENMGWVFHITVSVCEIYVDQVRDLLLQGEENVVKGEKLTLKDLNSIEDWNKVHELAKMKRSVAETMCNEKSSRSHCIFQINIHGRNSHTNAERNGALNLIDLAGSERVSKSKVEEERLKETISINKSLTALKSVIAALVSTNSSKPNYIPYRDSVLTFHLQNYLGGDSKTLMFVNISPILSSFSESSSSLKFAADVNLCYLQGND